MFDEKAGSEIIDGKEYVVLWVCVIATTESGGILLMEYDPEGNLLIRTEADEGDIMFDEISAGLYVSKIQHENRELLEELELYYKVFFLHQGIDS